MDLSSNKTQKKPARLSSQVGPAIMESIDNPVFIYNENYVDKNEDFKKELPPLPDVTLTSEFTSLMLGSADKNDNVPRSFFLVDGKENLKVSSANDFITKLGIDTNNSCVKVVSIFGNTGDGKSHTLNHLFFEGAEVFPISSEQNSCTVGVWAAFDKTTSTICIDTEGLLGTTLEEGRRIRLLLKVLAVSDVVIYRTRAERLNRDLFTFLGTASRAFGNHFRSAFDSLNARGCSGSRGILGPIVIISHETRNTKPLVTSSLESPEDMLKNRFRELNLDVDSFSSLVYIGQQTVDHPTQYNLLRRAVMNEINNTSVRLPRHPRLVYNALKALNEKFNGSIKQSLEIFPDEYFSCPVTCLSCGVSCQSSMSHNPTVSHKSEEKCRYSHQFENIVYKCKSCFTNGKDVSVKPQWTTTSDNSWFGLAMYAWAGYVIECPNCGEIYRSRQFWYGNSPPELTVVKTEINHVWPGMSCSGTTCQNSAQRVLDSVSAITEVVAQVTKSTPTKAIGSWVTDQINPKYWKPNNQIKMCAVCTVVFTGEMTKHHCRSCGEGVCSSCSTQSMPVPDRGWNYPVRVCDHCVKVSLRKGQSIPGKQCENNSPTPLSSGPWVVANFPDQTLVVTDQETSGIGPNQSPSSGEENEIIARKVGEAVVTTISSVASILEYPKSMIKETARPSYWTPDSEARECCCCSDTFTHIGGKAELHHCRSCGGPVCLACSSARRNVPHRGWYTPVRVCDKCNELLEIVDECGE